MGARNLWIRNGVILKSINFKNIFFIVWGIVMRWKEQNKMFCAVNRLGDELGVHLNHIMKEIVIEEDGDDKIIEAFVVSWDKENDGFKNDNIAIEIKVLLENTFNVECVNFDKTVWNGKIRCNLYFEI